MRRAVSDTTGRRTDVATTTTVETYDNSGNLIATRTVDIPPEIANAQTLRDRAIQALAANATFLAVASPSNAQIAAQVKALTRQVNGVMRLLVVTDTSTITDS